MKQINCQNSISMLVFMPLMMFLWQGSSCRTSHSGAVTNSVSTVNANSPSDANQGRAIAGTWGGPHISLEVTENGAEIDYDCAHGRITEKIVPDRNGNFEVKGIHVREHPGPVREGEDNEQPASYRGSIHDDTMTLTVTLTGKNETLGTFTLEHGNSGRVRKCK